MGEMKGKRDQIPSADFSNFPQISFLILIFILYGIFRVLALPRSKFVWLLETLMNVPSGCIIVLVMQFAQINPMDIVAHAQQDGRMATRNYLSAFRLFWNLLSIKIALNFKIFRNEKQKSELKLSGMKHKIIRIKTFRNETQKSELKLSGMKHKIRIKTFRNETQKIRIKTFRNETQKSELKLSGKKHKNQN
jgi:hypothetical protein